MGRTYKLGRKENDFYTDKRKGEVDENVNVKQVKKQLKQNKIDKSKRQGEQ